MGRPTLNGASQFWLIHRHPKGIDIITETIRKGDIVSLIDQKNQVYLINTTTKTDHFKGVGILNPEDLLDRPYGSRITVNTKEFFVFKPTLMDRLQSLKRKAQIILPKDAAHIIIHGDIRPGTTVLEAGIGSGALTTVLASMVQPNGKVISYEHRADFIKHAQKNLEQANLHDMVTIKEKDVTKGIKERNLHTIILDIPNPWDAVSHAWDALEIGGILCTYSPLISQMENTIKMMRNHPFIDIKTFETLQREMVYKEQGVRPSFQMLGHSGYLTFARKIPQE